MQGVLLGILIGIAVFGAVCPIISATLCFLSCWKRFEKYKETLETAAEYVFGGIVAAVLIFFGILLFLK